MVALLTMVAAPDKTEARTTPLSPPFSLVCQVLLSKQIAWKPTLVRRDKKGFTKRAHNRIKRRKRKRITGKGRGIQRKCGFIYLQRFSPGDTNLVLREFEKCGVILRHVPGPHDANWMHILYQSHFDAQKALAKNGVQINGLIVIGVKPLDPALRHSLDTSLGNQGVLVSVPATSARSFAIHSVKSSPTPYYSQASENNFQSGGAVALPSKSMLSKVMDLMLGT